MGTEAIRMSAMTQIDVDSLRPAVEDVELVAQGLRDVGEATAAELAADLRLTLPMIAGVLRTLERSGRARRTEEGWTLVDPPEPRAKRRSWHSTSGCTTEPPGPVMMALR